MNNEAKNTQTQENAELAAIAGELELALIDDSEMSDSDLMAMLEADDEAAVEFEAEAALDLDLDSFDADDLDLSELDLLPATEVAVEEEAPVAEMAVEEEAPVAEAKKAAPKRPTTARTTYINSRASDVLKDRLGGNTAEALVLEVGDIELDEATLAVKQKELMDLLNVRPHHSTADQGSTQKKVAEKIVMLFAYMKNGGKLNEVMARTFKILIRDGYIQSGDKGNLHQELLSKPYSPGTARAQSGQMMKMLPMLKIATVSDKGHLVANPESLILMKMTSELAA